MTFFDWVEYTRWGDIPWIVMPREHPDDCHSLMCKYYART